MAKVGVWNYIRGMLGHVRIERKSVDVLHPAEYNPRVMTDRQRQGLSNSIDAFGLLEPIVWNKRTGNVVGGHQRLYDIIRKGAKETDVVVCDLSAAEEKAANIALNHKGISGDYDNDKLQELMDAIEEQTKFDLNFDDFTFPDFEPATEDEQGELDVVKLKMVTCPDCGKVFNANREA